MAHEETITINKTQNKEYRLPCGLCLHETRHKVLQSVDMPETWEMVSISMGITSKSFSVRGAILFPFESATLILRIIISTTSKRNSATSSGLNSIRAELLEGTNFDKFIICLPPFLVSILKLIPHCAINNRFSQVLASGRLSTVCKEKAAIGSTLEQKIDNLVANGILTRAGAETLHSMRILGNEAAHEVKPHSEGTLSLAMDVVEHMLNDVYILPAATSKLPKRQGSKSTGSQS